MTTNRAISVFDQVDQILRNKIFNKEFVAGTRLPSESALAAELGVSRATIRMVLGKLETEGVVTRKHGDGTYVNKHVLEVDVKPPRIMAYRYMIEDSGRKAEVVRLSVSTRTPSKEEAEKLEVYKKDEVLELICLFLGDKQPVVYSINLFPLKIFTTRTDDYDVSYPMNEFVKKYTNDQIAYSVSDINAAAAFGAVAEYLNLPVDEPILKSVDMFYNLHNKPLAYGVNYYHPETFRLRIAQPWD